MLMALWRTSVFDLAGQTSTHTPQPVQSSGATWIVRRWPARSFERKLFDRNDVGSTVEGGGLEDLHADRGVRADDGALAAVDADVGIPDRDLLGDGPLLVLRRARRERAVDREGGDRQQISVAGHQHRA